MTHRCAPRPRSAQPETLLLPLNLPCLRDKAAVQLIDVLYALVASIEHHYAEQIDRYRQHQRQLRLSEWRPSTSSDDPPF
jgi:hypothetical protein